jgi:hypothetical protein
LVLPGCLAFYTSETVTVTVLDAESSAPIQGAKVDLDYYYVMCLNPPRAVSVETGSDGRVEIEEATFGEKGWKVSAPGYITMYRIQFLRQVEVGIHAASPRRMRRCAAGVR